MKRKILTIILLLLFIETSLVPLETSEQILDKTVIIVDNEGDGDFTSIKDALSYVNSGDTIEVYSGAYNEHSIVIEIENITLQGIPFEYGTGNDTGKPFIIGDGNSYIFFFNASNITFDGFLVNNDGGSDIIDISMVADRCIISNNTLKNTNSCFIYIKSSNNKIINNSISHSLTRQGICLRNPSHDNIVRSNRISDCETGILTWGSGNNLIEGNVVQNCISFGLDIGNDDNVIRYNTIKNNTIGIQLMSVRTTVSNNNFFNNVKYQATAYNSRFSWLLSNKWMGNYWGNGRILPYPILSQVFIFPWIMFDWHPALKPYDLPRMT